MGLYVFNWPIQFRWLTGYIHSSCYYYHQIGSINLTLCYHIFPLLCTCGVCYIIFCHLLHIHSEKTGSNSRMRFGLQIVFVYLYITSSHYHQCANFPEDIGLIKCLSYIFCRVCEWDQAYSLSYPLYNILGCVFSDYPSLLWWLKKYILCLIIIIKSTVLTITHCVRLGQEIMVCAVCLSIFLSS